ncbi:MAG: hypothetical protein IJ452_03945 [Butyricicoccus sp.]|nr:hypothetical protein [Butyricicoccus sp.]
MNLKKKCREIARRDCKLRPLMWSGLLAMIVAEFVKAAPLQDEIASVAHWIALLYALIVVILWGRNLHCPQCRRPLRGKCNMALWLPDEHTCGHCGAQLKFTEE